MLSYNQKCGSGIKLSRSKRAGALEPHSPKEHGCPAGDSPTGRGGLGGALGIPSLSQHTLHPGLSAWRGLEPPLQAVLCVGPWELRDPGQTRPGCANGRNWPELSYQVKDFQSSALVGDGLSWFLSPEEGLCG